MEADFAIQYGENLQPNDKAYEQAEKGLNAMNFDNNFEGGFDNM